MKLNQRERVLILFFPTVLVVAVYAPIFGAPAAKKLWRQQEQLESARASAVSAQELFGQRQRLGKWADRVSEAEATRDALRQQADALCGRITAQRADFTSLEALTELLREHNLVLMEEAPAERNDTGGMVASLEEATGRLEEAIWGQRFEPAPVGQRVERRTRRNTVGRRSWRSSVDDTRYRRLQFYGSFLDVVEAVDALARGDNQPIPVSIAMEEIGWESAYGNPPLWTLVVRI